MQTDEGLSRTRSAIEVMLVGVIYFLAAKASLLLAIPPGYATPVWPPSGIALAAVLLFGNRIWIGVWLGAALANAAIQGSPWLAGVIATGNTFEAVAAATLVRPLLNRHWRFESGENVVRFIVSCALCAGIAAAFGVGALVLGGAAAQLDVVANAWTWWQGDASGMIIVAPFLLSWSTPFASRWPAAKIVEGVLLTLLLAMTTVIIFGGIGADWTSVTLAFLALPFVVWAAIRFSQREVTTAVALVCAIAVWYAVKGHYPFGFGSPNPALLFLLAYTSTLVMTGLVLCAVIGERERAVQQLETFNEKLAQRVDDRTLELETVNQALREEIDERIQREEVLRQSEERFRLLVDGVKDYAIFRLDTAGNVASWNSGAENIYGYTSEEIVGTHFARLFTEEDVARDWPAYEFATARAGGRYEEEGWRLRKDGTAFWANITIAALRDDAGKLSGFAKVTRDLTVPQRVEALQENQRQMNEFLAMLSHELRNPLGSIVNALDLMRHNHGERSEARAIVERQVAHLAHIVDDLLDVSRITRGKVELRKEILSANDAVRHAMDSCRALLTSRGHTVDVRLSDQELWIEADPTRLQQVILNLINNAAKYTPVGGRIVVAVEREFEDVVLRVRDSGIGISPTLLSKVFDLFVQGERSLDRTGGGLGIGLTIVKRMVEMHGGSVEARSAGPGQGSEFIVRLPPVSGGSGVPTRASQQRRIRSGGGRRLLIVDDNRDFATSLAALLEEFGHETRVASDGDTGVALAEEQQPEAVLLDIGLPGMNGYEVARRLRNSDSLAGVTLVALSGYGQEEDQRLARAAGFDHYLIKPIDAAELINIIDALPVSA